MSANSTDQLPGLENLWKYCVYIVEGGTNSICTAVIIATILRYKGLRTKKEYIIILGLSLADFSNQIGYPVAGLYRIWLIFTGEHDTLVSSWYCMGALHNLLWVWSDTVAAAMLLVVSCDRFLCIFQPIKYYFWTKRYAWKLVGFGFGYCFISGLVGVGFSYAEPSTPMFQKVCFTSMAVGKRFYVYYYATIRQIFAVSSIIVYIVTMILFMKKNTVLPAQSSRQVKDQISRQRNFTKSLGISCMFTFVLYVCPMFKAQIAAIFDFSSKALVAMSLYSYILASLNPLFNVVIYLIRHKEMRFAMKNMFLCQHLAEDQSMWFTQRPKTRNPKQSPRAKTVKETKC